MRLILVPAAVLLLTSPALVARLFSRGGELAPDTVAALQSVRVAGALGAFALAWATTRPGLRPWLARLALAAATTLVCLGAAELALRASGIDLERRAPPIAVYRESADPHLVFELVPGSAVARGGVSYRTNATGYRGGPWPASCEVLLVGDSLVYGDDVAEDQLVGARLGAALGAPVVAAGVGGYGTYQERRVVELLVPRLKPRRVIVLFCFNDVDDPHRHLKVSRPLTFPAGALPVPPGPRPNPPLEIPGLSPPSRFGATDLVDLVLRRYSRLYVGARLGLARLTAPPPPSREPAGREWEHCVSALSDPTSPVSTWLAGQLAALAALGRQLDVPVAVAVAPLRYQLPPDSRFALAPRRTVQALCAAAGLPCLDLFPDFEKHGGQALFHDTCHFNADGHRVAAAALARLR